jgi:hypothetical protein
MVSDSSSRDKPQKKAPKGPAKRPAKKQRKLPERRAMIAAARRRNGSLPEWLGRRSRQLDRIGNRGLERAYPTVRAAQRRGGQLWRSASNSVWPWLRPLVRFFFRALAALERGVRRLGALLARMATAASTALTPGRAAGFVVIAAGALLIASQFIEYRAVEIGQPGYAGLQDLSGVAAVPTVEGRSGGAAHAYLLVPVGLAAMALGVLALRREAKRLGLLVVALGLVSLAVILLVDLPHGLDEGSQTSRFAGASAVLEDGFYAELAAAGGMVLAGLLYYARPCRIRINSSGRAASARRRRPRRRASSRARVARSA